MSRFAEIADLAEAASAEQQRELLEQLWEAVHGKPPRRNRGGRNPENAFVTMLDAEAFESASVMLRPVCRRHGPWFWRMGSGSVEPGWAHLNRLSASHCDRDDETTGRAKTPALAMIVAAARAHSIWVGR